MQRQRLMMPPPPPPTPAKRHHPSSTFRASRSSTSRKALLVSDDDLLDLTFRSERGYDLAQASSSTSSGESKSGEWEAYQRIPSDILLPAFLRQAQSNSLAASRAMKLVPRSILYPSNDPYLNIPGSTSPHIATGPQPLTTFATAKELPPLPNPNAFSRPPQIRANPTNDKAWESAGNFPPPPHPSKRPPIPAEGWTSKKHQLGSVNASWGPLPGGEGEKIYGVFEAEPESTGEEEDEEEEEERPEWGEVRAAKYEALGRARRGTSREWRNV